jgi:hypothetical protein
MQVLAPVRWASYKLPVGARRRVLFLLGNRRLPRFNKPESFNDKVNWRIINDRRPLIEWTCDKLAMKERARGVPGLLIPKTLWVGTDLLALAAAELPEHWVLKPNNRTGLVYFGTGRPEIAKLEQRTAGWLRAKESNNLAEWAYSKARPLLLAEELIGVPGSPPTDYKFFVFEGEVAAIQVDVNRHSSHQRRLYLPDWTPLEVRSGVYRLPPVQPPPAGLDRMLAIAGELGSEFDFIRIDLYSASGGIYFGEFTPYPGSGLERLVPTSFDRNLLGPKWKLPNLGSS